MKRQMFLGHLNKKKKKKKVKKRKRERAGRKKPRRRGVEKKESRESSLVHDYMVVTDFLFLFFFQLFIHPSRNWLEWPKLIEMGRNFFWGGRKGFLVLVCTSIRDFLAVPIETERYSQLWLQPIASLKEL